MRLFRTLALTTLALVAAVTQASAQPVGTMLDACSGVAQTYFRDYAARTDMQYSGQRVDGTYAVNGRIFLEARAADFACSFAPQGHRMIEFYAEGRKQNAYLPGGQPPAQGGGGGSGVVKVTGVGGSDLLNVRSGPGTGYAVIGKLANGDRVRKIACQNSGASQWCQIEMMTDMRERGWVNARYLTGAAATQLPGNPPPSAGPGDSATVRVRFTPGASGAVLTGRLAPGESRRYILGARNGQFLTVRLSHQGGRMSYQIFNPDRSFLLDQVPARQDYRGQLWQSGDHVVEVINRGNQTESYTAEFHIQ